MARTAASTIERPAAAVAELVEVDPSEIILGPNVRTDMRLDKEFIASIKERGVLEPVIVWRRDDGALMLLRGQRRAIGAVRVGLPAIQAVVVPRPAEADQVLDQVTENDHRTGLTELERANAYQQLAALGVKPAQIAKRLAVPRERVDAGLVAVRSEQAAAALAAQPTMTMVQAAVVAEFEDDPDMVRELIGILERGRGIDHVAQHYRDVRTRRAAEYAAGANLRAAGVRVITSGGEEMRGATDLVRLMGDEDPATAVARHADCPGHAAYMYEDEEDVADGDDDVHSVTATVWRPAYMCIEPDRHAQAEQPIDQAVADAERERAEAIQQEEAANNRAWTSATKVRRTWLRSFLARKAAPKGAAVWMTQALSNNDYPLRSALGSPFALGLLGVTDATINAVGELNQAMVGLLDGASDQRATVLSLGLVLAGYELEMHQRYWQFPGAWATRYLRFIEEQGYELSEVELHACGVKPKAKRSTRKGTSA